VETLKGLWHGTEAWLRGLLHWVEGFAATPYGTWALFVLSFAESSFFPIPPDVLLIALCVGEPEKSLWFALVCSVASVLGGMLGYGIGLWGGRPLLRRFFAAHRVEAVKRYYDKYDAWATGIAGLTPIPYKLFTIAGGAFAIDFKVFVVASVASRSLRFFAEGLLIYFFGPAIQSFMDRYLNLLTIGFVILLVFGFWLVHRGAGRAARAGQPEPGAPPEER
jgi:membrane protein YqaA with SNARE-associated domain